MNGVLRYCEVRLKLIAEAAGRGEAERALRLCEQLDRFVIGAIAGGYENPRELAEMALRGPVEMVKGVKAHWEKRGGEHAAAE
jgi:hypothetical protein